MYMSIEYSRLYSAHNSEGLFGTLVHGLPPELADKSPKERLVFATADIISYLTELKGMSAGEAEVAAVRAVQEIVRALKADISRDELLSIITEGVEFSKDAAFMREVEALNPDASD